MSVTLTNGLLDLSSELGETTTNTTTPRVNSYNDAVVQFFNEKKWPFSLKTDTTTTTTSGTQTYNLPMTDLRLPGGIKLVQIGSTDYLPIEYEDRNKSNFDNGSYFSYHCYYGESAYKRS